MKQKKASLIELFYISLLFTVCRPPDRSLLPRSNLFHNFGHQADNNGPLIVDNSYFYDDIQSTHLNGFSHDRYFATKSSILLRETLEVLEDINSLGRYSQLHQHHRSNLFAFPVSRGFSSNVFVQQNEAETQQQEQTSDENQSDIFDHLNFNNYPFNDAWENLIDDPLIQADDFFFQPQQQTQQENLLTTQDKDSFGENENESDSNSINNFLLDDDSDVMLPILDSGTGDVNDLFGELELLLSNETDAYGSHQEWQSLYPSVATATTNENGPEYPIYDTSQNFNLFEHSTNGQVLNNSSGQYSNNNNNFGAVLYSSLTTLSNAQDHLNSDLTTNLIYNGNSAHSDTTTTYLSNVSFPANNSTGNCFYNGYMEEFNISNYQNINNQQSQNFEYQPSTTISTATSTTIPNHKFQNANNEDCFDKSSDSAVSSMSSDRVQSLSDNDLIETSSESSYNCEGSLHVGAHNIDKCNAAAQKKYRLFGKNNNSNNKNHDNCKNLTHVADYYPDYSQVNYIYSNSVPCPVFDSNDTSYNQLNYYTPAIDAVSHNHTYAQMPENESLHSISSNVSSAPEWLKQENIENDSPNQIAISQRQKAIREKSRDDNEHQDRDHHFNRDEKRARSLNIPISTHDIINLPIDEFNERLTKYELTEIQLSLIRDIRRRGKNKVAAQNCRKRKLDQIMGLQLEVDNMYSQKDALENQYNQWLMLREMARDKYTKLYQFVVEASSSQQPFFDLSSSPPDFPVKDSSSNEIQINDNSNSGFMVPGSNLTASSSVHISSYGGGLLNEYSNQQK